MPCLEMVRFQLPLLVGVGIALTAAPLWLGSVLTATPHHLSPQILLLIDIEQSYINTNHEDFIGFAKYVFFKTAAGGADHCPPSESGPERGS